MAYTQAQLDAIEQAIASGTLRVKYSDKEVTYRSLDELIKARDVIRKALGVSKAPQRSFPSFSKGLTNG